MAASVTDEVDETEETPEDGKVPGGINSEELGILYQAAKIENRALSEQLDDRDAKLASWAALGGKLMEMLGVEDIDAILPAVGNLTKNRQARRSEAKASRGSRGSKRQGGG